jgi:hypothetical protein
MSADHSPGIGLNGFSKHPIYICMQDYKAVITLSSFSLVIVVLVVYNCTVGHVFPILWPSLSPYCPVFTIGEADGAIIGAVRVFFWPNMLKLPCGLKSMFTDLTIQLKSF